MNNLNSVLIEGFVVGPPLLGAIPSGTSVCRFSIATNRYYRNSEKEVVKEVSYVDIDTWGSLAENCAKYLDKGRQVRVVGRLKHDRWEDDDKTMRENYVIVAEHVEFFPMKKSKEEQSSDEE